MYVEMMPISFKLYMLQIHVYVYIMLKFFHAKLKFVTMWILSNFRMQSNVILILLKLNLPTYLIIPIQNL